MITEYINKNLNHESSERIKWFRRHLESFVLSILEENKTMRIKAEMDLETILNIISVCTCIPIKDIKGRSRKRNIVTARHLYCFFSKNITHDTLENIGRQINRDHGTVINSIDRVSNIISFPLSHEEAYKTYVICNMKLQNITKKISEVL